MVGVLLLATAPAHALFETREDNQSVGVGADFEESEEGGTETVSGPGGGSGGGEEPPSDIVVGSAGTFHGAWGCVTLNEGASMTPFQENQLLALITEHGLCPEGGGSGGGGGGVVETDPSEEAMSVWLELPLATPDPRIEPGWMVVGKPAYLEPNTSLGPLHASTGTPVGELELRADSRYRVDWGDALAPGARTYHVEGAPWPHGRITHIYQHAGLYDITVEQVWRAQWRVDGGEWNDIDLERERSAAIPDFEVIEVQAVRQD